MNHTVTTANGAALDFDNPTLEAIDIDAIMYQLAHECRWVGNVKTFYSVLQHACLVASDIPTPHNRIYAFAYHFPKAYLGGMPAPLQRWAVMQGADLVGLERKLFKLVCKKLKLKRPSATASRQVTEANSRGYSTEIRDVVKTPPQPTHRAPLGTFNQIIKPQAPLVALEKAQPIFQTCLRQYREAA